MDDVPVRNYSCEVDWWSFGVMMYELIYRHKPFEGCDREILYAKSHNPVKWYYLRLPKMYFVRKV